MSIEQKMKAPGLSTPITKILAITSFTEKAKKVPATLRLHLSGKIEQWYIHPDISGPVFIINTDSIEAAKELLAKLPLGIEEMMVFQLIPMGPLTPLRILLND